MWQQPALPCSLICTSNKERHTCENEEYISPATSRSRASHVYLGSSNTETAHERSARRHFDITNSTPLSTYENTWCGRKRVTAHMKLPTGTCISIVSGHQVQSHYFSADLKTAPHLHLHWWMHCQRDGYAGRIPRKEERALFLIFPNRGLMMYANRQK